MNWLKKAAARGEPRALLVVGTALFNGDGMKQDPVLGYAYVSRAAAQGLAPAKSTLAEMDKIMSLAERQKGVAMAIDMAKAPPAPAAKTAQAKPPEKKPAVKKPAVETAAPAKAQATARGAWRVQLGAFSTRGAAEGLFKKLAGSAALAGRQAYYIPVGKITRLQVGPFESRASAASACAKLAPQPCFTVEAR
jgi:cell division septation protein DedD